LAPIEQDSDSTSLFEALQPEMLVTFGGLIVSKKIKKFLRQYKPKQHFHIDPREANDTFFSLTQHFEASVNSFFKTVAPSLDQVHSSYFESWNAIRLKTLEFREIYRQQIEFTDFAFYYSLFETLPQDEIVHFC